MGGCLLKENGFTFSLKTIMPENTSPDCFVLKILEKSDIEFPFTVAALTLNLYGQYSSKPVTDSVFMSHPEISKCNDINF